MTTYQMIDLRVEKFSITDSIYIIEKFKENLIEEVDFKHLNFGHYKEQNTQYKTHVRVKMNFLASNARERSLNIVKQLRDEESIIIDFFPSNWTDNNQTDSNVIEAITLSCKCAIKIGRQKFFRDCWLKNERENNFPPNGGFLRGFFHVLFNNLTGVEMFEPSDISHILEDAQSQEIINSSVNEIVELCRPYIEKFFHFKFFERFEHMLCNNLLYLRYYGDDKECRSYQYDDGFLKHFLTIYDHSYSDTVNDACKAFCDKMHDSYIKQ